MKRSGYRTVFHMYLIFFIALLGTAVFTVVFLFLTITIKKPDGTLVKSNWPSKFSESFKEQIVFIDEMPHVTQAGLELLQLNKIGLQIVDPSGHELFGYQKPEEAKNTYSIGELLQLSQTGHMENLKMHIVIGTTENEKNEYIYMMYFPVNVSKVTMDLNGQRFAGGKRIVLFIIAALGIGILVSGALYGWWMAHAMKHLTTSIHEISIRSYLPVEDKGTFRDLYSELNQLDAAINESNQLRMQVETMRKEWIANITHDLKTPLSPIKGYAELLSVNTYEENESRTYAKVMLKNACYMETLIEDMKLTYQLEMGMLPMKCENQNVVRFLKELVIDLINSPEYEERIVHFKHSEEQVWLSFNKTLFTRAFRNLIINAFLYAGEDAEITVRIKQTDSFVEIDIIDNGIGMSEEVEKHLFDRYYRGKNTEEKPEGTGLGLAIAKSIMELHKGKISVMSTLGIGTTFQITFPKN